MAIKMKRQMWLVLGVAILLVGGCGGGGGGGGTTPPADPRTLTESYFPFSQGNLLNYEGRISESGTLTDRFFNALTVGGTHLVGSVSTTVITESNPENGGVGVDLYYHLAADGITDYGNNDATDTITEQLVPYPLVEFPMVTGNSFVQLNKSGLTWDTDEDGDGTPETFDIYSVVTLAGFETLTLRNTPFADTARLVTDTTITVRPSTGAPAVSVSGSQTLWCAPDYGPIKRSITVGNETTVEEAVGMRGSFGTVGLMPQFTPLTDIAPADEVEFKPEVPGRPAIASDGENFLVVSSKTIDGLNSTLVGTIVDSDGLPKTTPSEFQIAPGGSNRSAAIFNGQNYVVIYEDAGHIYGQIVRTDGTTILGTPIKLSSTDGNFLPVIAHDNTLNQALIVWVKFQETDSITQLDFFDLYAAVIDVSNPISIQVSRQEYPLIGTQEGDQNEPSVASDGSNYMVTWRDFQTSGGSIVTGSDIHGIRINGTNGDTMGSKFNISNAPLGQGAPQIAFDGLNFFAVWVDWRNNRLDIFGTGITPAGLLLDGPAETGGIAINTAPVVTKGFPFITFDGTNYLVTWSNSDLSESPNILNCGIFGRRITTNGDIILDTTSSLGQPLSAPPPSPREYIYPVIHSNGAQSLLVWPDNKKSGSENLHAAMIWPL